MHPSERDSAASSSLRRKPARRCCCRTSHSRSRAITRGESHRPAHRRTPGGSDGDATVGPRGGDIEHFRRARRSPRAGGRNGHREGEAARRTQTRRGHPAGLHHPARARLQHGGPFVGQGADRRRGRQCPATAQTVLRFRPQHRRGRQPYDHVHRAHRHGLAHGRGHLRGIQGDRQQRNPPGRKLQEKRIFPAINFNRSGTRREEYLTRPEELQRIWILRKLLQPMEEIAAMEFLVDRLKTTRTNSEFFESMRR